MRKIAKLTPEQVARFPEFVERWTRIGLCTDPADRPAAERAIGEMYRVAGLPPPERIIWCGSPLSQALARQNAHDIGASVWGSVAASVRASVWASVRASVAGSVWGSVGASVWDPVTASVWGSVAALVKGSVAASVAGSVYGCHDAGWLSFYDFFHDVLGLETDKLRGLLALARSAGWALPHQRVCWVSERHNTLNRDERGRLHCLTGPAVAYPDGWAIYAVHGVRVPEQVIMCPETLTLPQINGETNDEVQRVMVEQVARALRAITETTNE